MSIYLSDCQFQQLKAAAEAEPVAATEAATSATAAAMAAAALNALKENFICRYRAVI